MTARENTSGGKATSGEPRLDPVAVAILAALARLPRGATLSPMDVARTFAESRRAKQDPPDLWRRYLPAAKQQMLFLARSGRIEIVRRGEPVDPKEVKGVVRMRLPAAQAAEDDSDDRGVSAGGA